MYHRVRRRNIYIVVGGILLLSISSFAFPKSIGNVQQYASSKADDDNLDSNIIDFDEQYSIKFDKKFGAPEAFQNKFNKEFNKYTVDDDNDSQQNNSFKKKSQSKLNSNQKNKTQSNSSYKIKESTFDTTPTVDYSVIPLELVSTTENILSSIVDSTTEDLTVIPLSTTTKVVPNIRVEQTVTLPTSTQTVDEIPDELTEIPEFERVTDTIEIISHINITTESTKEDKTNQSRKLLDKPVHSNVSTHSRKNNSTKTDKYEEDPQTPEAGKSNIPIFTELDLEDETEAPEDYYDSVDVIPTKAPSTDAVSVLFGLAGSVVGSVVESVAERVVPKGIFDLFKRMQRQNEALEAEKLRSKEENGGIGQFGRGILKSISSGLGKPLSQLMAGVRDIGSLDNDRSFVNSLASGVTSVADYANSLADAFKDRVQAIYPGTVWCGDGRSQTARSGDLGLFFFTDTCCRQHDACKLYILAGETKFGLTNTGIFTRSHCSCDAKFRECLRRTNSLVSSQIGLTYFNVLGPQCFRRAHPIIRCIRRTRITGQKCEEYELDYTKPKMWQWFDSKTF